MICCSHDSVGQNALVISYARDSKLLGHRYALDPSAAEITVGRHADNTIKINSDMVSRRHTRFEKRADGWWVVDWHSSSGTFLNDQHVSEALLRRGDRIGIGDTILKVSCALCEEVIEDRHSTSPIDGLTQAYSRRYFMQQLDEMLKQTEHPTRPLALVIFDIDHFKKFNDSYGYLAGDLALREIASMTREHLRSGDVLARFGGEEFALLLPETDLQEAAAIAETIRTAIAAHLILFEERQLSITISAGIAQADEKSLATELIASANEKLYQAKRRGRNCVVV